MSRREAREIAPDGVDIDAPRAKRRRAEGGPATGSSPDRTNPANTDSLKTVKDEAESTEVKVEDPEEVKKKGLSLWQSVKDAVSKDGRSLSHDFLRLPSKRQYPDYYQLIKRPISLDEIKIQLENGLYTSLEDVRQDIETCFKNAKRYNMRDSQIWKDAKQLHKHALQEHSKITGTDDAGDHGEGDDHSGAGADGAGGSDDEGGKKKKVPNMNRLLKARLQKLVDKTDESGRVLSSEFMELPNRRQWPIYYKAIKRPQCLENVFKHLKRKEYHTAQDFAKDVELVFSNALEFNQEHTEIWDDAMVLRDYFRLIMSDLPSPFTISAYSNNNASVAPTKLKLKVPPSTPAAHQVNAPASYPSTSSATPANNISPAPAKLVLHVPAPHPVTTLAKAPTPVKSPVPKPIALPAIAPDIPAISSPAPIPTSSSFVPPPGSTPPIPTGTLQPAMFTPPTPYASNFSQQYSSSPLQVQTTTVTPSTSSSLAAATIATVAAAAAHVTRSTRVDQAVSISPSPSISRGARQLKRVWLDVRPLGRRLELDYRDGVKTWVVQLGARETEVRISRTVFRGGEGDGDESSEEEDEARDASGQQMMEEEEEEEEELVPEPEEPKIKRRGRGRPSKKDKEREARLAEAAENAAARAKGKARARELAATDVQVNLNGVLVSKSDGGEGWVCQIPTGTSVLEIGEKTGQTWRVYMSRPVVW